MPILPVAKVNVEGKPSTDNSTQGSSEFANTLNGSKQVLNQTQATADTKANTKTSLAEQNLDKSKLKKTPEDTLALLIDTAALPFNKSQINTRFSTGAQQLAQHTDTRPDASTNGRFKSRVDINSHAITGQDKLSAQKTDHKKPDINDKQPPFTAKANSHINNTQSQMQQLTADQRNTATTTTVNTKSANQELKSTLALQLNQAQAENSTNVKPKLVTENNTTTLISTGVNNDVSSLIQNQNNSSLSNPNQALASVNTPISSPNWAQDFSVQVSRMVQNNINIGHTVQMQVNPPDLGPVHITLHMQDGITQASFVSPHAAVRHAIEAALPNLQDQLNQAGLSLGQADVSDQQASQQQFAQNQAAKPQGSGFNIGLANGPAVNSAEISTNTSHSRRPDALVDTFA